MFVDDVEVANSELGIIPSENPGLNGVYYSEYASDNDYVKGVTKLVENNEPVFIGGQNTADWGEHYFFGALDNITLFNRSLSGEEIHVLFDLKQ